VTTAQLPDAVEICGRNRDGAPCLGVIYRSTPECPYCYRCGATDPGVVYVKKGDATCSPSTPTVRPS
jgi:hypothetical protein